MDKIASMENSNPKLFCKLIKDLKSQNNCDNPIPLDVWEMYFKNLGYEKQRNKSNFDRNIQTLTDQLLNNNTAVTIGLCISLYLWAVMLRVGGSVAVGHSGGCGWLGDHESL